MCFPRLPPNVRPDGDDMGFDNSALKLVLESFVDEVAEESTDLILERPRFVHAVVIVADESNELCQASCIRRIDDAVVCDATESAVVEEDEAIARALRELLESREMLSTPRESVYSDSPLEPSTPYSTPEDVLLSNHTTNDLLRQIDESSHRVTRSAIAFPSLTRSRRNV